MIIDWCVNVCLLGEICGLVGGYKRCVNNGKLFGVKMRVIVVLVI